MAYEKTVWNNDGTPAIDADNLNKIEQGIADSIRRDGDVLGGNLDANSSYTIKNLPTPTKSGDAANKSYTDGVVKVGSFTISSNYSSQTISLGFTPSAVIVSNNNWGDAREGLSPKNTQLAIATAADPQTDLYNNKNTLTIVTNGFLVSGLFSGDYKYIAFR